MYVFTFMAFAFNSKSATLGENTRIKCAAKLNFLENTYAMQMEMECDSKPIRNKKNYHLAYQAHFFIAVVADHRHQVTRSSCNMHSVLIQWSAREVKKRWKNVFFFSFVYFHQIK